jgi:hypothetical protein
MVVRGLGCGTAGVTKRRRGVLSIPTTDSVLGTNSLWHNFKLVIQEVLPNSGLVVVVCVMSGFMTVAFALALSWNEGVGTTAIDLVIRCLPTPQG